LRIQSGKCKLSNKSFNLRNIILIYKNKYQIIKRMLN
jgi:hypothetical protein